MTSAITRRLFGASLAAIAAATAPGLSNAAPKPAPKPVGDRPLYKDPAQPVEARVRDLLSRMTLEEKAAQLVGIWLTKAAIQTPEGEFSPEAAGKAFPNGLGQISRPTDRRGLKPVAEVGAAAGAEDGSKGRKAAEKDYMWWGDHAFLRKLVRNRHWVDGRLMRGNQPSPAQLAELKAQGIKTIINLRGGDGSFALLERDACEKLGLKLVDLVVTSREVPSRERVLNAKKMFESIEYPAFMHCKSGADRAGLMSLLAPRRGGGRRFGAGWMLG